jgi:hypothetical protein
VEPNSWLNVPLTLKQLGVGMVGAAVTVLSVSPFLGGEVGLAIACNVVFVNEALLEADYRRYIEIARLGAFLTFLLAAVLTGLLTFGTSYLLLNLTIQRAEVAAVLSTGASVLSMSVATGYALIAIGYLIAGVIYLIATIFRGRPASAVASYQETWTRTIKYAPIRRSATRTTAAGAHKERKNRGGGS